jgi:anti-sigma factor (TIGR02949 family)
MTNMETTPRVDRFTCEQVFQRLDDYLDRELTEQEIHLVREHLAVCEWCTKMYDFHGEVLDSLKQRLSRLPAPPSLLSRIHTALEKAVAGDDDDE